LLKRKCLSQNHQLFKIQWRGLNTETLDAFEPQLFAACKKEYFNPANIPPGEFRVKTVINKDGLKYNDFYGQESFVKQMMTPGRRAIIRNPDTHPGWFPKEVPWVQPNTSRL
jgi:hypothetical protein